MKSLARRYVWWPKIDSLLEEQAKQCMICQNSRKMPTSGPLHPWEWPDKPWLRLHVDYLWQNVIGDHRCLLQMARGVYNECRYLCCHHRET